MEDAKVENLTLIDQRTGKDYEVPIENDAIYAMSLRQIKVSDDDFGMLSYDPAYKNTASTKSTNTFIDGERGILEYRGYPIAQLAKRALSSRWHISSSLESYPISSNWMNGCSTSRITPSCMKT